MSDYKLCPNGHYYHKKYTVCPYCPENKDFLENDEKSELLKTRIWQEKDFMPKEEQSNKTIDNTKTQLWSETENNSPQREERKLVGWLVSYTLNSNGKDFRLYEGKNTMGTSKSCDISLENDKSISTKHLTILFRNKIFKFKDEFSTNGTYINEEFLEEGELKDGDKIKIGNTILLFRTAF